MGGGSSEVGPPTNAIDTSGLSDFMNDAASQGYTQEQIYALQGAQQDSNGNYVQGQSAFDPSFIQPVLTAYNTWQAQTTASASAFSDYQAANAAEPGRQQTQLVGPGRVLGV
jgi:hypothetical protein